MFYEVSQEPKKSLHINTSIGFLYSPAIKFILQPYSITRKSKENALIKSSAGVNGYFLFFWPLLIKTLAYIEVILGGCSITFSHVKIFGQKFAKYPQQIYVLQSVQLVTRSFLANIQTSLNCSQDNIHIYPFWNNHLIKYKCIKSERNAVHIRNFLLF